MLREGADRGKGHAGCSRRERETCPQERGWVIQLHAGREPGSSALCQRARRCAWLCKLLNRKAGNGAMVLLLQDSKLWKQGDLCF